MTKLQSAYDTVVDYLLGVAYRLWFWLGKVLELPYGTHETVYKDRPETQETLVRLANSNAELIAERDELKEQISSIGVPQRSIIGAGITGPSRPNARKLTKREVEDIRGARRRGWTQKAIADAYDLNPATVSRIVRGVYYKGVTA